MQRPNLPKHLSTRCLQNLRDFAGSSGRRAGPCGLRRVWYILPAWFTESQGMWGSGGRWFLLWRLMARTADYICICICTCTHIYIYNIFIMYMYVCVCACACIRTHATFSRTHIYIYIYMYVHIYIHIQVSRQRYIADPHKALPTCGRCWLQTSLVPVPYSVVTEMLQYESAL